MPLKVLEWIKCLDLAQQALLIIFSQTTTTRLSKELLACVWPDTHSKTQNSRSLLVAAYTVCTVAVHGDKHSDCHSAQHKGHDVALYL